MSKMKSGGKSDSRGWNGMSVGGGDKSSTAIDKGTVNRGGSEKAVTTARLMGKGSNESTYGAMKGNVDVRHKSGQDDKASTKRSGEQGPGTDWA